MIGAETQAWVFGLYFTQQVWGYFREGRNEQVLPSFYTAQLHRTTAVFLFQISLVD